MKKEAGRRKHETGGKRGFILLLVSCFLFASCSLRRAATAVTADIISRGMAATETESDLFVAKDTALSLIKILDVLHYGDPKNKKFLGLLSKAYGSYAFGFAELEMLETGSKKQEAGSKKQEAGSKKQEAGSEWRARTKEFYRKGMEFGLKATAKGGKALSDVPITGLDKSLKKFGKKDANALFWTALNWGAYINMSRDDITIAADLPRVEAVIDRVIEIDRGFHCGIAHAFKGAMIAGNPLRMMKTNSGGAGAAAGYFKDALELCSGQYLMTKVMYAEWYARAVGDRTLFERFLNEVIEADAAALPAHRTENELAKERARVLLEAGLL